MRNEKRRRTNRCRFRTCSLSAWRREGEDDRLGNGLDRGMGAGEDDICGHDEPPLTPDVIDPKAAVPSQPLQDRILGRGAIAETEERRRVAKPPIKLLQRRYSVVLPAQQPFELAARQDGAAVALDKGAQARATAGSFESRSRLEVLHPRRQGRGASLADGGAALAGASPKREHRYAPPLPAGAREPSSVIPVGRWMSCAPSASKASSSAPHRGPTGAVISTRRGRSRLARRRRAAGNGHGGSIRITEPAGWRPVPTPAEILNRLARGNRAPKAISTGVRSGREGSSGSRATMPSPGGNGPTRPRFAAISRAMP